MTVYIVVYTENDAPGVSIQGVFGGEETANAYRDEIAKNPINAYGECKVEPHEVKI